MIGTRANETARLREFLKKHSRSQAFPVVLSRSQLIARLPVVPATLSGSRLQIYLLLRQHYNFKQSFSFEQELIE